MRFLSSGLYSVRARIKGPLRRCCGGCRVADVDVHERNPRSLQSRAWPTRSPKGERAAGSFLPIAETSLVNSAVIDLTLSRARSLSHAVR